MIFYKETNDTSAMHTTLESFQRPQPCNANKPSSDDSGNSQVEKDQNDAMPSLLGQQSMSSCGSSMYGNALGTTLCPPTGGYSR